MRYGVTFPFQCYNPLIKYNVSLSHRRVLNSFSNAAHPRPPELCLKYVSPSSLCGCCCCLFSLFPLCAESLFDFSHFYPFPFAGCFFFLFICTENKCLSKVSCWRVRARRELHHDCGSVDWCSLLHLPMTLRASEPEFQNQYGTPCARFAEVFLCNTRDLSYCFQYKTAISVCIP